MDLLTSMTSALSLDESGDARANYSVIPYATYRTPTAQCTINNEMTKQSYAHTNHSKI